MAVRNRRSATPQSIPVLDLEAKEIGEETLDLHVLSKQSANYVVHQYARIWVYMNKRNFSRKLPMRQDVKNGKKPWAQKGSGRARHGTRYSPLFGKSFTSQKPQGLNNKRKLKMARNVHYKCISTVLQSKWRTMKIIQGLEDWPAARQGELETLINKCTGDVCGKKSVLIITRKHWGEESIYGGTNNFSYDSPLYMSGRLIPKLEMRRPRDIDPEHDGLYQVLKGRHILISREAFFDLLAKYGPKDGWAWKLPREILVEQMQALAKEFPMDRASEIEQTRELPLTKLDREAWAEEKRKLEAETA